MPLSMMDPSSTRHVPISLSLCILVAPPGLGVGEVCASRHSPAKLRRDASRLQRHRLLKSWPGVAKAAASERCGSFCDQEVSDFGTAPPGVDVARVRCGDPLEAAAKLRTKHDERDSDSSVASALGENVVDAGGDNARHAGAKRIVDDFASDKHSTFAPDFEHLLRRMLDLKTPLWAYVRSWLGSRSTCRGQRGRDIFPLPSMHQWPEEVARPEAHVGTHLLMSNVCLGALNFLAAGCKLDAALSGLACIRSAPTKAQKSVLCHVASRCALFLQRISGEAETGFHVDGAFAHFERCSVTVVEALRADKIDCPSKAATCDAQKLLPPGLLACVSDPAYMFPEGVLADGSCCAREPHGDERHEYLRLIVREILAGKLRLRRTVNPVGSVFAVAKSGGRQREIWDGSKISASAAPPPSPLRLGSPACFADVQCALGESLLFSKRNASTYFDQLQAPRSLQPWFGRPAVTLAELSDATKVDAHVLIAHVDDSENVEMGTLLHPVSQVWPMGYSWSSAVAQSCTLHCVLGAGMDPANVLCMDEPPPPPREQHELCTIVTDDVVFIHRDESAGSARLKAFDCELTHHGIPRNEAKDVNLQPCIKALGCELSSKPALVQPSAEKLLVLVEGLADLVLSRRCTPRGLNAALGLAQWFCLLQRPCYSIFHAVYEEVRQLPAGRTRTISAGVVDEVGLFWLLSPLLPAAMDRQHFSGLLACDASSEYGFGVFLLRCGSAIAEEVTCLAERRGDFVRLFPEESEPAPRDRLGKPHRLPFRKCDFSIVVSKRAVWRAHSSALEAHGLLLAVKWVSRAAKNYHKRIPIMIDAKAVLGAASKGRSSAPALVGPLRQLAALVLTSDLLLRLVYIPTEDNPADAPSRGKRLRSSGVHKIRRTTKTSRLGTRSERRWAKIESSMQRLYETGMLDCTSSSSSSSW